MDVTHASDGRDGPGVDDDDGRPTTALPNAQLVRLSLYWLGLSSIFTGLTAILSGRIQFDGLGDRGSEGTKIGRAHV